MKFLNKTAFFCSLLSMLFVAGCAGTHEASMCQTKPTVFSSIVKNPNQALHTDLQLTIIGKVMIDQFGHAYSVIKGNNGSINLHKIGQYEVNGAPVQVRRVTDTNTKLQLRPAGNVVIDQFGNVYSDISKNGKINLHKIGQYKVNNTRAQPVKFVKHSPEANITAKPANKSHKYVHLSVIGNVMIDQLGNVYSAIVKNGKMKLHKIGQYKANNIKALPFKHMDKKGERQLVSVGKLVVDQHGSMYFDLSKNGKVSLHRIGQYKVNNTRAQPVKFVKHSPVANITAKPANKSHKYVHLSVIGNVMIDQLGNVYSAIVKNGKMKLHKIGQYKANNIKALPFKHMDKKGERQLVSVGKLVVDQHGSMYFDLSKNGKVSLHKIGQYKVLK